MPKINRPWFFALIYLFSAMAFAFALGFAVRRLPDIGQPRSDTEVWIYGSHNVTQNITPVHNGLNVLTVYMRNIGLRNRKPLAFALKDQDGRTVREISLNGYNVGDGDSVRFQFPPVTDSGGKTYGIVFSSPESDFSDAIGVGFSGGSISYQAYYFPSGRIPVIRGVLASFFTSVLKPEFLILFLVSGLASLGFGLLLFEYNHLA